MRTQVADFLTCQTVGECLDEWSKYYLSGIAGSTAENYKSLIDRHIRPALGSKLVSDLTTADVNGFLIDMAAVRRGAVGRGSKRIGYAKSTINLARKVLGMGLQHAKSEGRVTENVARDAKVPEATVRRTRSFTSTEVSSIARQPVGIDWEAAWLIQLGLGIRPGELLALSWRDVVGSELHIGHSQRREGGKLIPRGSLKTRASMRVLEMPSDLSHAIERRRVDQEAEQLAAEGLWENSLGLIFTTERGQPLREKTYRRQFRALLKRAEIDLAGVTPHTFRHTTASLLVDAGVPLGTISDLLGHADMTMLVKNYRHSTSSKVTGHLAAMEGVLQPESKPNE